MVAILTWPYPMYTKWDQRMVEHLIRSQECNPSFETLHSGDCVHDGRFSQHLPLYCSVSTVRLYFCRQTAFCFDKALSTNGFVRFYFAFFCVGISIFLNRSRWFRFIFPLLWISFMILLFLFSLRKRHSNAHTSLDAQRQWTQWRKLNEMYYIMISFWFYIYTCEQYPNVFYRFWTQYTTIQNEIHTYTKVPFDIVICAGFQCYEKCMVFSSFCMPSILDFIVRIDTIWNKSAMWFRRIMVHRSWKYNLIEIDWNWAKKAPSSTQTCFFVRLNLLSFDRRHPFV